MIGALLNGGEWDDVAGLRPNSFFEPRHQRIFAAMVRLAKQQQPIDSLVALDELAENAQAAGGAAYLDGLTKDALDTVNLPAHAAIVRKHATQRRLTELARQLHNGAQQPNADIPALVRETAAALEAVDRSDLPARPEFPPAPEIHALENVQQPEALLRRIGDNHGRVLGTGEVCVLSAAGGVGKTYLTIQIAEAATRGPSQDPDGLAETCGLQVRRGNVLFAIYEDDNNSFHLRLLDIKKRLKFDMAGNMDIRSLDDLEELWQGAVRTGFDLRNPGPGGGWERLWDAVEKHEPKLVVIDPASAAFTAATNDSGEVRSFMRALANQAKKYAVGILLVAHSTKAARYSASEGSAMGAGVVAGSATWFDAARTVLALRTLKSGKRLLECAKANHGLTGWGAILNAQGDEDGKPFTGFALEKMLNVAEVDNMLEQEKKPNRNSQQNSARRSTNAKPKKDF